MKQNLADYVVNKCATYDELVNAFPLLNQLLVFEKLDDKYKPDISYIFSHMMNNRLHLFSLIDTTSNIVVGVALLTEFYSALISRKQLYLDAIYVLPEYQGNGFSKLLFSSFVSWSKQNNYISIFWKSLVWNTKANEIYKKVATEFYEDWKFYKFDL